MANVEHNALTDPELHEPKGAAAATANQLYVADGAGSGAFESPDPAYAQGYTENNTTATTISTVDTPVQINFAGGFNSDLANKFTISTAGAFTYDGTKNVTAHVSASLSAIQTSAATKEFTFFVAKNGTVIDSSLAVVETDGSVLRNVAVQSVVELVQNDVITFWVENTTDTTNITVGDCSASIVQLGI